MFADAGSKPPPGMGTATPRQVGEATAKAIERNKVEVTIAPLPQRAGAHLALVSPSLSVKVAERQRRPEGGQRHRLRPLRRQALEAPGPAEGGTTTVIRLGLGLPR